MRSNIWLLATISLTNARKLTPRQTRASLVPPPPPSTPWHPKTNHPEFFSLRVDTPAGCNPDATTGSDNNFGDGNAADCTFINYAIRLENGIAIATPYNQWWDPKLPIMFVDDDTKLYTVSKQPLEFYINTATGALRYAPVGWLPPNSISSSFYHTGNNPLGVVGPSTAFLSWPSTQGVTDGALYNAPWWLCPLGRTGQYQVFVNNNNFGLSNAEDSSSGVSKDPQRCQMVPLAAINANPWAKAQSAPPS